jgi:adenylate cyclase
VRSGPDPGGDAAAQLSVPGFGGRPAIAVLAFDNLSGDPEQEFFADGIAEDLITRLSSWRLYPVIARNSSFVYRGKAVDVKQVSADLGVRYVVEGSVRKAGDRVRISAQLIDATSGHHVWAERYDRRLEDVFSLQDEITEAIVGAIHPEIAESEQARALGGDPASLDAWEIAQRGWWHFNRFSREENAKARELLEQAIALDPRFGWPHFVLSQVHYTDICFGWRDSPERLVGEVLREAQTCVVLDSKDAYGQVALATAYSLTGQREEAVAAAELAMELNPCLSMAYLLLGSLLAATGRPDEGIAVVEKGMRLSPRDPWLFDMRNTIAAAHFAAGRYEESLDWAQRSLQLKPDYVIPMDIAAASCAHLGRIEEACERFARRLEIERAPTLETIERVFGFADPDFQARFIDGLRKAGWDG